MESDSILVDKEDTAGNPWRGPDITWHVRDIKDMVEKLGREGAIDRLVGDMFTREYVGRIIDEIIK